MPKSLVEKFWDHVPSQTPGECWEWVGSYSKRYGSFHVGGNRCVRAHRFAYEQSVGPIPDGLVIDHLCSNPPCVNPAHLEAVTQRENLLRSSRTITGILAAKTHCVRGHPFDEANTFVDYRNKRICLTCRRMGNREYKARRRARAQEASDAAR